MMPNITWNMDGRIYRLETEPAGRTGRDGKVAVRYRFAVDEETVFEGEDFGCSPMHEWDSDESTGALLGFLTLGRGDTDSEYFDEYTPRQLEFRDEDPNREYLALEALVLEGGCTEDA